MIIGTRYYTMQEIKEEIDMYMLALKMDLAEHDNASIVCTTNIVKDPDCAFYRIKYNGWEHERVKCFAYTEDSIGRRHILTMDLTAVCYPQDEVL